MFSHDDPTIDGSPVGVDSCMRHVQDFARVPSRELQQVNVSDLFEAHSVARLVLNLSAAQEASFVPKIINNPG